MQTVFVHHGMEFVDDAAENNDTPAEALDILPNGSPFHATYFKDTGSGAGTTDTDYYKFETQAGLEYLIETTRLVGDANTSLVLLRSDGVTVVDSNDDRSAFDRSSLIDFTAPDDSTFYVKSFHGPGLGIYGSYDISITGGFFYGGSDPKPAPELPRSRRKRMTFDGQTPGTTQYITSPQ